MFISLLNAAAAIHNFCDSCHSMYSLATNALTSIIVLHLVTFYSLILGKSQAIEFSKATQKPTKSNVFSLHHTQGQCTIFSTYTAEYKILLEYFRNHTLKNCVQYYTTDS